MSAPPYFVISTGRCGSTFLSETLNRHPAVLSISEFLFSLEPEPFPAGNISGGELAHRLSRVDPLATAALAERLEPPEFRYPVDGGGRFNRTTGVPAVATIALPTLSDDPDAILEDLVAVASRLPSAPIGRQYAAVFEWFRERFGGDLWVERSGGSIRYLRSLNEQFPQARFIHLYRDGRETAISMSTRPNVRLMMVGADIERITGVNPFNVIDPPPLANLPPPLSRLVPGSLDFQALADYPIPLERFGRHWSSGELRGLRGLRDLDPGRVLALSYEDLVMDPTASLERLGTFLEVDTPDPWVAWATSAARQPTRRWPALPEPERSRLDEACRMANVRLYGPAGPPQ